MPRIVIFANGELPVLESARRLLRPQDYVICADAGANHALALGLKPDLVVGDMDSIDPGVWKSLLQSDVRVELYPREKDETDMELAIERAVAMKPDSILIMAALGGRLDQTLGNLFLLSNPSIAEIEIRMDDGEQEAFFCRGRCEILGIKGDIVSLIPWGGEVAGVHTEGLQWSLAGESLLAEKTRGISNEMIKNTAWVTVDSGLLLVTHIRQRNGRENP